MESKNEKSIYKKMQEMRVALQKRNLKKTGHNDYSNYDYYELEDFLPSCNEIMSEAGVFSMFQFIKETESASLTFIDVETGEKLVFTIPYGNAAVKGANIMQNIGATITYARRYLYMIAFEISESENFDSEERENETKPVFVSETMIKVLSDQVERTGFDIRRIYATYDIDEIQKMTVTDFTDAMEKLKKLPDKKQANLAL